MSHSFFGFQIAVRVPAGDPWRARLRELVVEHQRDHALLDQRAFYTRLANHLNLVETKYALGFWEYIAGGRADQEFDSWVAGLEASAEDDVSPDAGEGDHVVVSAVFLLEEGSDSDRTAAERCDIPESEWSARQTFVRLVATLRMLHYSSVQADGVYVVPGDPARGLPLSELQGEGWDYLNPLT